MKLLKNNADYDYLKKLSSHGLVFLLKHSFTCPISASAKKIFEEFYSKHQDIPCFILNIQETKNLSNQISEQTGISHESPQVLVFKDGSVIFNEDHQKITLDVLEEVISNNSEQKPDENQT